MSNLTECVKKIIGDTKQDHSKLQRSSTHIVADNTDNVMQNKLNMNTQTHSSQRDELLRKLPEKQQIEILKWAESHGINPNDPMWVLVDMLGYTQRMTDTLPKKMYAAGQQAVEAIASQRAAESEAFAYNAFNTLDKMLSQLTEKVAVESEKITDIRLRQKLWYQSLLVSGGILTLSSVCFIFWILVWLYQYSLDNTTE